jgi:hypothetical protein
VKDFKTMELIVDEEEFKIYENKFEDNLNKLRNQGDNELSRKLDEINR